MRKSCTHTGLLHCLIFKLVNVVVKNKISNTATNFNVLAPAETCA